MLMAAVLIKFKPETVAWQRWYPMSVVLLAARLGHAVVLFCRPQTIPSPCVCAALAYRVVEYCCGFGVLVSMLPQQACRVRSVAGFGWHVTHGLGQCGR